MKFHWLMVCLVTYVTSAHNDTENVTFNLPYVDGTSRQLVYNKKAYSECVYKDFTKLLICGENNLYNDVVNVWNRIPEYLRYVSVNCLRIDGSRTGNDMCVCKSAGTGNLATEPYTYCHLKALSAGGFNRTYFLESLDLSDNQISEIADKSFSGLRNIKYISLARNPLFNIPYGIFCDTPTLEYLDLSQASMNVFPSHAFICKSPLEKLEAIDLSNSGLKDVPADSLKNLPYLVSFDLGGNELVQVYKKSFSGGESLQHLNLSDNALRYLFPHFCDYLPKLTTLHLRRNNFDNFQFEEISNCSKVEVLDLSSNRIVYFTGSSTSLLALKSFNISNNALKELNFSLPRSTNLQWMDASFNKIVDIKDGFMSNHSALEHFNISHNALNDSANFVVIFREVTSLLKLDLSHNHLTTLPANSFKNLKNLTHLFLDYNILDSLDGSSFSGLESLEYLQLSHNRLSSLPTSVFNGMTSLSHVTLSFNALTSLEATFWPPLVSLALDNNLISRLSTVDFSRMETLNLSRNKLSEFIGTRTDTVLNFGQMVELDLSFNSISEIAPRLFQSSTSLKVLNLAHNNLSFNISFEFLNNARNLEHIDLSFNKFEEIGSLFSNESLTNITIFNISHNMLKKVNRLAEENSLSKLTKIDLTNCGITDLAQDVFSDLPELEFVDLTNNAIETFPVLIANDHAIFDFTDNPIVCACNMSWLLLNWVEISSKPRLRVATHNFHVPLCKVYTEPSLAHPLDLYRSQYKCLETAGCDHRCSCYKTDDAGDIATVICHNGLSSAPSEISPTASSIFLDGNMFTSNESMSTFLSLLNMSAKELYLNRSGIIRLDSRTFHGFSELITFSLANNNLERLPGDIFRYKNSLKELYLNDNKLSFFETGVFDDLPSLRELDISGNNFAVLPPSTLTELSNLKRIMYFFLSRNAWSCNCTNAGFKEFIDEVRYKIRDRRTLYCDGTTNEILYQTKSSFSCLVAERRKTNANPMLILGILVAILLMVLVFAVVLYFRRELLSLLYYATGCRIPTRQRIPEMHFDCYLAYDPLDQHCSDYVEKTVMPRLRNNGYIVQTSAEIIPDVEVTQKVIDDSRCSLFIIDRNFTSNPFYVNAFQMSLDRRKRESCFRVIILVLGDIDLLALQPDVMKRLRKGDYVTARSRVWWQRLVYELPAPGGHHSADNESTSESDVIVFSSLNESVTV